MRIGCKERVWSGVRACAHLHRPKDIASLPLLELARPLPRLPPALLKVAAIREAPSPLRVDLLELLAGVAAAFGVEARAVARAAIIGGQRLLAAQLRLQRLHRAIKPLLDLSPLRPRQPLIQLRQIRVQRIQRLIYVLFDQRRQQRRLILHVVEQLLHRLIPIPPIYVGRRDEAVHIVRQDRKAYP